MAPLMPMTAHLDFGAKANGVTEGVPGEQLQFVRDAIDGKPTVSGVRAFVMGTNSWIDLDDWPPPSTPTRLWLDVDGEAGRANVGALNWQRPRLTGTDRYRHDAAYPVPTMGGRSMNAALPMAGPMDQTPVEARPDVLVYSTRPLTHNLTVAGPVTAQIGFQSSAERADVTVKLVDVYRDGRAINIADSVRRVQCRPGEPQLVSVDVGSTAITFRRGHRIRVEIASSNFPRFDVLDSAEQAVQRGGSFASYVELPVYSGTPNGGGE
jgi:putative CocE/NonD family hydrolase